nr:hypothetical protein [Lachnospiraceae bacterium]
IYEYSGKRVEGEIEATLAEYMAHSKENELDVSRLMEYDKETFYSAVCYSMLGELPTEQMKEKIEDIIQKPEAEFRKEVLLRVRQMSMASSREVTVKNDIYTGEVTQNKMGIKRRLISLGIKLCRNLPLGLKIKIKEAAFKMLGR